MTPVPKNLSKKAVLAWRRAIARGTSPVIAAKNASGGGAKYLDGDNSTSLSRVDRGVS